MDYNNIKNLLEKYWEGETTVLDEILLKEYFSGEQVAEDLEAYRPLFVYLDKAKAKTSTQSFDELKEKQEKNVYRLVPSWIAVAASIFIIGVAGLFYCNQATTVSDASFAKDETMEKDTYRDPQMAYNEAKAALLLISKGLNKGMRRTKESVKKVRE